MIQVSTSIQVTNTTGFSFPRLGGRTVSIPQTVEGGGVPGFQKLTGDTPETVGVSELTALGLMYIKNTHDSVVVEVGKEVAAAFQAFNEVRPGEEYVIRLKDGIVLQLKAVGVVDGEVQIYVFED